MSLLCCPSEILMEIGEILDDERDIYSVIRVNRRLFGLLNGHLYRCNIKYGKCRALFWAAKHGRESTARKSLHFGADANITKRKKINTRTESRSGLTALHIVAEKGHIAIVKLLLEAGANPEARFQGSLTPLHFALNARHEEVARTISSYTSNLRFCLVDLEQKLTPLHLSCYLGLWKCARFFLNKGADVNALDAQSATPLHYSLL